MDMIRNGSVTVERKNNLITQYLFGMAQTQVLIPAGTDEDRVRSVMVKLSSGRNYRRLIRFHA